MLFDINMDGESDGFVTYHQPVAVPRPIKPFSLRLQVATGTQMLGEPAPIKCELCILYNDKSHKSVGLYDNLFQEIYNEVRRYRKDLVPEFFSEEHVLDSSPPPVLFRESLF